MGRPLETSPYRLLVEGTDDFNVILHLLKRHGYDWDNPATDRPFVLPVGGFENMPRALAAVVKGKLRLGIVVDADDDCASRWEQLRGQLASYGIKVPADPDPAGTIIDGVESEFKVGIWLMPDNSSTGTLEHFIEKLIPANDLCWDYAHETATEARGRYGGAGCPEKDHLKSRLYTWLAWQREPGRPFGTALAAKVFDRDSPASLAFRDWFLRLFPPTSPRL